MYTVLRSGRYRFGEEVVDVTPAVLREMVVRTSMPMPILLRHNAEKIVGEVTYLGVSQDGTELVATVSGLKLVPAISIEPPEIQEISITGVPMLVPEPIPDDTEQP